MRKSVNGRVVEMTAEEIEAMEAHERLAVDTTRQARREQFRREADSRIAQLTGPADDPLRVVIRQINLLSRALRQTRAEAQGDKSVSDELDAMEVLYDQITAIRAAENDASLALDGAGTDERQSTAERIAAIEAITASWP